MWHTTCVPLYCMELTALKLRACGQLTAHAVAMPLLRLHEVDGQVLAFAAWTSQSQPLGARTSLAVVGSTKSILSKH